jgi:DNA-binding Lrp family transcriptional regulator
VDDLARTVIDLFATDPRIGVLEASRRLGVARGTVQARLDKLSELSAYCCTYWPVAAP